MPSPRMRRQLHATSPPVLFSSFQSSDYKPSLYSPTSVRLLSDQRHCRKAPRLPHSCNATAMFLGRSCSGLDIYQMHILPSDVGLVHRTLFRRLAELHPTRLSD